MRVVEPEIAQRASALGGLVEGLARGEQSGAQDGEAETDSTWGASGLAAGLIRAATLHIDPVSVTQAEALIGADVLRAMCEGRYVRVRGDHVELRAGLSRGGVPNAVDRDALGDLRALVNDPERRRLWISVEHAHAAYELHRAAYPSTPPWTSLAVPPALARKSYGGVDGYDLGTARTAGGGWLHGVLEPAAAQLWHERLPRDRDGDQPLLAQWLELVADGAVDAARHLTGSARARLLDAATAAILIDPELGTLQEETAWLLGPGSSRPHGDRPSVPENPTLAQVGLYWDDLTRNNQVHVLDTSRGHLHRLIMIVMRHDSRPFERVLEVAEAGASKPYLAFFLAWCLSHHRPEALAWLLTRASTAAFGLGLLAEQELAEPTMMDGQVTRTNRIHSRRMMIMAEALPLVVATLAEAATAGARAAVANAIIDSLRTLVRRAVRRTLADDDQHRRAAAQAMALYAATEESFSAATTSRRIRRGGEPKARPTRLLDECLDELHGALPAEPPLREVIPWLFVAHTLLAFVRTDARTPAEMATHDGRTDAHRRLLTSIVLYYTSAFDIDDDADSFAYFPPASALLEMRWERVMCGLFELGELGPWLRFDAVRRALVRADAAPGDREIRSIVAGCAARLRAHLEVLVAAHPALDDHRVATHTTREGVRAALEAEIRTLTLPMTFGRRGEFSLFDREVGYGVQRADIVRLVPVLAQTIGRFDSDARRELLSRWVTWTTDPLVLLQLERTVTVPVIKEQIRQRLLDPLIVARASRDMWLDVILTMTSHAAAAGHTAFAEQLLARADEATRGHPLRRAFEQTAFRTSLLLAYRKKDRAQIAALPLPPLTEGETVAARELRAELSASRDFYLALVDLDASPEHARETFARQLGLTPHSATLALNLFVAELHIARARVDAHERKEAFEHALRVWERIAPSIANRDSIEPHATCNELEALDGAELDDELDRRWLSLTPDQKVQADLVAVRIQNLERRQMSDEIERARALVRDANGGIGPSVGDGGPINPKRIAVEPPSIDDHQRSWNKIRALPPSDLALIVGGGVVADFLRDLHLGACAELQRRYAAIATLKDENKLNDLIVSFLGMSVGVIGWTVRDQSRGGRSKGALSSKGGVGARDWTVNTGNVEIAIGEAVRLDSVDTESVVDHLTRLVDRYNPQGASATFMIVFFEGRDFDSFCERYRAFIADTTIAQWSVEALEPTIDHSTTRRTFRAILRSGSSRMTVDHIVTQVGSRSGSPGAPDGDA